MKITLSIFLLLGFTGPIFSQGNPRYALVIGVKDYQFVQPLKNSLNDARDMAATLKGKGFEIVEAYNPVTKREMQDAVRRYFTLINAHKEAAGLIYYSGHSMQVDGVNYLMPTGSNPQLKADLEDQAMRMDYLLGVVEQAGNSLNIIIMDACRNNPFRSFSRSSDPGLSQVNAPKGSYVVYATAPGSVASDGVGRNGLFTSKLLKYINTSNVALEQVFKYVARDVQQESQGAQVPWINYSYFGDFYFEGQGGGQPTLITQSPATKPDAVNSELVMPRPDNPAETSKQIAAVESTSGAPVNNTRANANPFLTSYAETSSSGAPCTGEKFKSNKKYFRVSAMGEDEDQVTSKKKALAIVRKGMEEGLLYTLKDVTDTYITDRGGFASGEEKLCDDINREITQASLGEVQTICEKLFVTRKGIYKTWLSIELRNDNMLQALENRMASHPNLKVNFNSVKFRSAYSKVTAELLKP